MASLDLKLPACVGAATCLASYLAWCGFGRRASNRLSVARARELGVSEEALLSAVPKIAVRGREQGKPSHIRVLQWNILAQGMSDDGFLVQDVLRPADPSNSLEKTLDAIDKAKASGTDLGELKAQFETPRSKRNFAAVVDWKRRWEHIKEIVVAAEPDVITLQELDRMADAERELGELGFVCALPHGCYAPAHAAGLGTGNATAYLAHLERQAVAFAANTPSTCRKIALRNNDAADDDGCAIFWRKSTMVGVKLEFLPFKDQSRRYSSAVRATLRRKSDGNEFAVMACHLSSGDKPADEAKRIEEIQNRSAAADCSLCDWFARSLKTIPTIFCLDANSSPERTEDVTVWKSLRGVAGAKSVWDDSFAPDGKSRCSSTPVSVNKMRGPLSEQAGKIGLHAFFLIDHIYYASPFSLVRHCFPPLQYKDARVARNELIPSLSVPSDHAPVIVDLDLPLIR